MARRRYFVSYSYLPVGGGFGTANAELWMDHPICSFEDIKAARKSIESETEHRNVVVMFWRRFEEPE